MANLFKKRGQKFIRRFSRASNKARVESKEHIKENFLQRLSHIKNIRLLVLEWVLLAFALIMLSAAQAFWFANSYARDEFSKGGNFVEATVGRVNSMNPLFATTSSEKILSKLMFATLTDTDYSGHPGLGLANYVRAGEGGKTWTIKLRPDLKWSDGEPLTNEDVLFTIGLIQNPAVNTIYGANLEGVKVSEGENGEITFTLPSAYADFVSALEFPVVPKHELEDAPLKTLIEDDFSLAPVTSGAFMFNATQATTLSDEEVVYLSANPYYYKGKPLINSFTVHVYADKPAVIAAANSSAITATAELSGPDAEKVTSGNFIKRETGINAGTFIFFNTSSGSLKSVELRRALRQGINIEELRALAPGTNALDYPILKSQMELSSYPAIPGYNPEAATEQIASIKGDGQIVLNIAVVNSGYLPIIAEELASELQNLGIEAHLTVYEETQEFVANIISKRSYDILVYEIEMGADPDPLPYYHSSQASTAGLNLTNYRNSMVDDLLVGARDNIDRALRARKYESFLEYWVSDVPAIGVYQANLTYIYNKNVRVYSDTIKLTTAIDRFYDVESWAVSKEVLNLTP